jgi:hypothetical protein
MGRSFGWDQKNRSPISQQVWHDEDPSLLKDPAYFIAKKNHAPGLFGK